MTQTLYKYLPNLGVDYFEQPTFKITPPSLLNDPFESIISNDVSRFFKRFNLTNKSCNMRDISNILKHCISSIGIISLSETHRSLLMWAHYANEHKGFCIGVKNNFLENDDPLAPVLESTPIHNIPVKVKYDTERFEIKYERMPAVELLKTILTHQLTVKSDDWMYEKEYRSIICLLNHDQVKIVGEIPEKVKDSIYCLQHLSFDPEKFTKSEYAMIELVITAFAKNRNALLLKNIPTEKIDRIYLGHRFDKNDMKELLKRVSNKNHPLHHVDIYKNSIHPNRFALTSKLIHSA